jgi:recombination protein RecA
VNEKVVDKSGTWFSYGEERLGQGRENVKRTLQENPDLLAAIERQVREKLGLIKKEPDKPNQKIK